MDQERWRQIEYLFHSALEIPLDGRAAFLAHACGGDAELRDELGSLLRESEDAEEFLAESALSIGISLLGREYGASSEG